MSTAAARPAKCPAWPPPNNIKETAARLVIIGLWIVVIEAEKKKPIGLAWGLSRKDIQEINRLLSQNKGAGLGICLGPDRGPGGRWLIDLEGDGPLAEDSLTRLCGGVVITTMSWSSSRGKHYVFTVDGERLLDLLIAAGASVVKGDGKGKGVYKLPEFPDLEIRCGGYLEDGKTVKQFQSVIPPTAPRQWIHAPETEKDIAELPEAVYTALEAIAEAKVEQAVEQQQQADSQRDAPWSVTVENGIAAQERLARYLVTMNPAISGQGGHNATIRAAAMCVRFGFDQPEQVFCFLRDHYNNRCQPRWNEKELRHKAEEACKTEKRRDKVTTPRFDAKPSSNGNGHHDTLDLETAEILDRWPKAKPEMFHGIAGEIVRLAEPHSEGDPVAILVQFLIAFGNMMGRHGHFIVGATRHYLNLYIGLIGETAIGRKGTSWDVARWLLAMFDPAWAENRIQGGLVSGEGLIFHVRDERFEEQEVQEKDAKGKKTGVLKRQRILVDAGVTDKRLLIIETEMSRMLKAMNRDTNTLSDVLRQGWDSGNLRTLGKQSPAMATQAHVSLICHATQADIRKHLTETDSANGFANRFLWCCARRSKILPDGGDLMAENWSPIKQAMRQVIDDPIFSREFQITRDPIAKKVWHQIYPALSAGKPGLLGKILSRAEAQVMRLACLYAMLDRSAQVTGQHLLSAAALWEYCEASARLIFGEGLGDPDANKLLAALKADPAGLTRKQISIDVFGRHKTSKDIVALLSDLLTQGLIYRKTDASTGGRPPERWHFGKVDSHESTCEQSAN